MITQKIKKQKIIYKKKINMFLKFNYFTMLVLISISNSRTTKNVLFISLKFLIVRDYGENENYFKIEIHKIQISK